MTFKIDEIGFYKTRNGKKCFVNVVNDNGPFWGAIIDDGIGLYQRHMDGSKIFPGDIHDLDIIAKWKDEAEEEKPKINLEVGKKYELESGDIYVCIGDISLSLPNIIRPMVMIDATIQNDERVIAYLYHKNGIYDPDKNYNIKCEHQEKIKVEGWVNVYDYDATFHKTKTEAKLRALKFDKHPIATIFVSGTDFVSGTEEI